MSFQNSTPSSDQPREPEISIAPLSGLEMTGAICAKVIHDLSNLMSGIVGNAEFARNHEADPASVHKAIQAISVSANAAGKLLGQCLPLQLLVSNEAFPYDVSELALIIAEAAGLAPGWRVAEPAPLTGQVRVQPRWLTAALWQIAREADAQSGEIEFVCGPVVFPVVCGTAPERMRATRTISFKSPCATARTTRSSVRTAPPTPTASACSPLAS
jgi:hypothetical protein